MWQLPPDNRVADARFAADAAIGPDDGAADDRVFLDLRLAPNHGIGADPGTRLHERATRR
jgi:hypothetical protein